MMPTINKKCGFKNDPFRMRNKSALAGIGILKRIKRSSFKRSALFDHFNTLKTIERMDEFHAFSVSHGPVLRDIP
jgi:hypothetical protein